MNPRTILYEQDFYAWTQEQATLLDARHFMAGNHPYTTPGDCRSACPESVSARYALAREHSQHADASPHGDVPRDMPLDG